MRTWNLRSLVRKQGIGTLSRTSYTRVLRIERVGLSFNLKLKAGKKKKEGLIIEYNISFSLVYGILYMMILNNAIILKVLLCPSLTNTNLLFISTFM